MEVPINFLSPKLRPKVHCSSPAMDNYEVTNLISEEFLVKSRGFLAYSTIKPPIEINFTTLCEINVDHLVIGTVLGTQRSTGIEVFFKINNQFVSVGQSNFNSDGIVFCNKRLYSQHNLPPNIPPNYTIVFFKVSNYFYLNTDTIRLKIFKTEKSVPCLSNVEIWGKVSRKCSKKTVQTINNLVTKKPEKVELNSTSLNNKRILPQNFKIPDEFLDSLTFEIMSIPITLPSGNTVDESTLEKFISVEASQGRPPSDPFTAQRFNDGRKPVFNGSLKSRIDMFLLENSHRKETSLLKRTVGNSASIKRKNIDESDDIVRNLVQSNAQTCSNDFTKKLKTEENVFKNSEETLDELIKKAMNSANFVKFTSDQSEEIVNEVKCCTCDVRSTLYSIPCKHLYCKSCLLNAIKLLTCKICKAIFLKCDITKVNTS